MWNHFEDPKKEAVCKQLTPSRNAAHQAPRKLNLQTNYSVETPVWEAFGGTCVFFQNTTAKPGEKTESCHPALTGFHFLLHFTSNNCGMIRICKTNRKLHSACVWKLWAWKSISGPISPLAEINPSWACCLNLLQKQTTPKPVIFLAQLLSEQGPEHPIQPRFTFAQVLLLEV